MVQQSMRPRWAIAFAVFIGIFAILSIKTGGEILFIDGTARKGAGNYVPFVLWFNFLASFAYLVGAIGLVLWRPWVKPVAITIASLNIIVFAAFGVHILMDGAYEMRTIGAMALRSLVWISVAFSVRRKFP